MIRLSIVVEYEPKPEHYVDIVLGSETIKSPTPEQMAAYDKQSIEQGMCSVDEFIGESYEIVSEVINK